MAYVEVTEIVEGAFNDEIIVRTLGEVDAIVDRIRREAAEDGLSTEVWVVVHNHPQRECECAQYLTDHRPYATFNQPTSDA